MIAGTATAVSGRVARRQQQRFAEQDAALESQAPAERSAAESAPQVPDYITELEKLSELNAAGVLTDEEFDAKKRQLLGI